MPSMDTQESSVKRNFKPLIPQDDEDEDILDMDDVGDDNLVETDDVSLVWGLFESCGGYANLLWIVF